MGRSHNQVNSPDQWTIIAAALCRFLLMMGTSFDLSLEASFELQDTQRLVQMIKLHSSIAMIGKKRPSLLAMHKMVGELLALLQHVNTTTIVNTFSFHLECSCG